MESNDMESNVIIKVTIPGWKILNHWELYEILEYRDGAVYKTKSSGVYLDNQVATNNALLAYSIVHMDINGRKADYQLVSPSTKDTVRESVTINKIDPISFNFNR